MDETMNEEFSMDPERVHQITHDVCLGESSYAAASLNQTLHRMTALPRRLAILEFRWGRHR